MLDTPVLFLIFKRPDLTLQVFKQIKEAKPSRLFIAADGPRIHNADDADLCAETRRLVLDSINWKCEVKALLRNENLGCRVAVPSAISWFFEHVEEGIILEDDCLPHPSFFIFCREMLHQYRNNPSIFHISGNNLQLSQIGDASYYLSKIPHEWGWATWRRAWINFGTNISTSRDSPVIPYFNDPEIDTYWKQNFIRIKDTAVDEWGFFWSYALLSHNAYAIQPQYNLVKNIGFDNRSARTFSPKHYLSDLKTFNVDEIIHLKDLLYDNAADINFQKQFGWYVPFYENRISGTTALKTLLTIIKRKFLNKN